MQRNDANSAPTLSNYQLRLSAFEGPLDVLLRLIERSQLAIEDVSLVAVTSQFLAYVASLDHAPPPIVAEFAAVGARLTLLKSRSLLPRPPVDTEEPEQSDLTMQLREYQQTKLLAAMLTTIHRSDSRSYAQGHAGAVERPTPAQFVRLAPHEVASLATCLRRRLSIIPKAPQFVRQRRVASLRELAERVMHMVSNAHRIRFSDVTAPYTSRTDVATAFLATLVLIRRQVIGATQGDLFSEITLEKLDSNTSPNGLAITEDFAQS